MKPPDSKPGGVSSEGLLAKKAISVVWGPGRPPPPPSLATLSLACQLLRPRGLCAPRSASAPASIPVSGFRAWASRPSAPSCPSVPSAISSCTRPASAIAPPPSGAWAPTFWDQPGPLSPRASSAWPPSGWVLLPALSRPPVTRFFRHPLQPPACSATSASSASCLPPVVWVRRVRRLPGVCHPQHHLQHQQ